MEISRFPNKLRSFRRRNGYSRKKVARVFVNADPGTLSRWERGILLPGTLQVFRLARIYHTLPHELFYETWNDLENDESLLTLDDESINSIHPEYI